MDHLPFCCATVNIKAPSCYYCIDKKVYYNVEYFSADKILIIFYKDKFTLS